MFPLLTTSCKPPFNNPNPSVCYLCLRTPTSESAEKPLQQMVEAIKAGSLGAFIPFNRKGEALSLNWRRTATDQKEKARYLLNSRLPLSMMVGRRGLEPRTKGL